MPPKHRPKHRRTRGAAIFTVLLVAALAAPFAAACSKKDSASAGSGSAGSAGSGSAAATGSATHSTGSGAGSAAVPAKDIDSKDILARTETAPQVWVKHVLIGWKELAPAYRGQIDPRAGKRTNDEAATLAQDILAKLKANPDSIDALVKESSEDPGSMTGDPYMIKADSPWAPEFTNLGLRLKDKEAGIVRTKFGYHVMIRVAKPPVDPLESADILARPTQTGPVFIQHIVIGWKDTPAARSGRGDKRAAARTKEDADKLVTEVLGKIRGGADMDALMKQYSEDPRSQSSTRPFQLAGQVPRGFETLNDLGMRLKLDEAGLAKTPAGWFILKRVAEPPPPPPPPGAKPPAPQKPDALDSADILKREPPAKATKVKHILLGWTEAHADDPRGKTRDRATLEKLVKDTVAKLKGGAKIEPLMAELSEDQGSAKSGMSYDVAPDSGLVEPFKNLSLRLKVGETGVVRTQFGIHIIQRIE